jgi:prepilin-type N-terminal cleavage/methylation domain-containing protein
MGETMMRRGLEQGFSLVEMLIAILVLAIVAAGVMPLAVIAVSTTENQGHLMARSTEYAQDKLEQLLTLAYGDVTSDTRVFPATFNGGSGLTLGGSADPSAPVALYVDYLDIDGNVLPAGAGVDGPETWFYQRVWSVAQEGGNLKRVTVTATVRASAVGGAGLIPRSTVTALKTFPF